MEDLKKSILDMMAEKLDEGLRLMENRVANVEVKLNNNNPESFQYQQLLDDLKQNKDESQLQFEKIEKEAEAMSIKNDQLELKISDLLKNMENLRKDEGDKEDQLQIQKELEANQRQQMPDDRQNHEEVSMHEVYKYRKEVDEKNNMCHQLEREIEDLRKELEAKDIICQDLELEVSQVRQHPEFILMRQQLLDDLKGQEELHLREVKELRKELEAKDNICYQLEIKISQVRENPEFLQMRQQLLDELKGQEELHLLEVNELHKELEEKDKICHQLEHEMFGQENADFIHMRQQLMDNLKDQEERHLREMSDLRKVKEDKEKLCLEKEQEAVQLRDRLNFSESCPICMDPWNSSEHRMVALLCGHIFGESCVRECLERNPNCPTCRAQASTNDIRKLFTRS
ncbi:centrosomal protein of 164 kDa-like isoform X3 [Drosophila albomicans]|uniref:Centrosomal protein of 164 kDa-like isoform X3 n=1 Tax=Drosophila albomicans TaxID=7291 RepID=A0A6P8WTB7_DROAB|nr:centrosomal protein of 164 kDa-like isoform X3 [Drosophila albomicans]XP_051861499.1 centrosomal protein of 164 kDa-like isoform X3 [Drosophila albomicans]